MRCIFSKMLKRDRGSREKIEKCLEPVLKQRQPVLYARVAAAFAHRFIKQVIGRRGAEFGNIARAKTPDRLGDELKLRDSHKIEPPQLFLAALGLRVERAYCFQCVAEKIEANGHIQARRIKVQNAAAHRILPRFSYGRGADKAIELKPVDDPLHADDIARRD